MQIDISFRHMEPTDTLRDYADEKLRRVIRKHIRDDFDVQVTLSVEKIRHIAKFLLSYKGISIKCEESSDDMYQSIDLALDKLERQIRRYKNKLRTHKPDKGTNQRVMDFTVVAVAEEELDEVIEEAEVSASEVQEVAAAARIVRSDKLGVETMSIDDAIMRIDLEDVPVLVFVNEQTETIHVLYRMKEGEFGIIDTSAKSS